MLKYSKRFNFFFAFCAFVLLSVFLQSRAQAEPPTIVVTSAGKAVNIPFLMDYLTELEKAVSQACPGEWPKKYRIVAILPEDKTARGEAEVQDLPLETRILLKGRHFKKIPSPIETELFINSLFQKKDALRRGGIDERKIPEWMICALAQKVRQRLSVKKTIFKKACPTLSTLASSGNIPSLKALIENPIMPSDGSSWILCGEACELVFDAIASLNAVSSPSMPEQMIDLASGASVGPYAAFSTLLCKAIEPKIASFAFSDMDLKEDAAMEDKLQVWFRYLVLKKALNIFNPARASFTKLLAERALVLSCEIRENDKEEYKCRDIRLDEIDAPEKIKDLDLTLARLEKYFSEIMYLSNSELTPRLRALAASLSALKKGRPDLFKKDFLCAWNEFDREIERVGSIEEWISILDSESGAPARIVSPYRTPVKQFELRNSQAWPALDKFLDSELARKK